jgi:predicted secreted protein
LGFDARPFERMGVIVHQIAYSVNKCHIRPYKRLSPHIHTRIHPLWTQHCPTCPAWHHANQDAFDIPKRQALLLHLRRLTRLRPSSFADIASATWLPRVAKLASFDEKCVAIKNSKFLSAQNSFLVSVLVDLPGSLARPTTCATFSPVKKWIAQSTHCCLCPYVSMSVYQAYTLRFAILGVFPMKKLLTPVLFAVACAMANAGTTVDLSSEAMRATKNDLVRATVYAESTGQSSSDVVRKVNGLIAQAVALAKEYKAVTVQTGATSTYPMYGKSQRIDGWRMRSDISLESTDAAAISELLGTLQSKNSLAVAEVASVVSPQSQAKLESLLLVDALHSFKEKADLIAQTFGKNYKISKLAINGQGYQPVRPMPMMRSLGMVADAAPPMPIEAGESSLVVVVTGQIELD